MKNVFFLTTALMLLLGACKKDTRSIDLNVSAVEALYTPADSQYIKLNPAANISQTFQWQQAHAEDGSPGPLRGRIRPGRRRFLSPLL
ncbi:hypothetical protein ACQ86N_18660 [Puia sp. P3]|uniref:hypothetical protein n=1 Tax=Puia sp. P3 TaxID=3423952 RepID=UPI003D66A05B